MIHENAVIYPDGFTNEEKCRLWIELGLASEQEYDVLKELMDTYQPTTPRENKLVFLHLLDRAGELSNEEYQTILQNIKQG